MRRIVLLIAVALGAAISFGLRAAPPSGADRTSGLHYAPNGNFDHAGNFLPARYGFNVADIHEARRLKELPDGVRALVWIGQCDGVSKKFLAAVSPFLGDRKVFGFYLMDDPDPRPRLSGGRLSAPCRAESLKEESDWLHEHMPGTQTVIVLMNLGTGRDPSYANGYDAANSHVDLFGLAAYPCRTDWKGCDYDVINRYMAAGESAGVPRRQIIPIYQAFGGGRWKTDEGGSYILPTPEQETEILDRWRTLIPAPVLDMAYSWGSQRGDAALQNAPSLQEVFSNHNHRPMERP